MAMKRKRNSTTSNRAVVQVDAGIKEYDGPSFADLPCAITTSIVLKLPMKYVLFCKCVCKSWNTLISDPQFAKLHFKSAPAGVLIRTNDPKRRVSRTLHLLDYEPEKLGSYDDEQFCLCEDKFLKAECNRHIKLGPKFKLPLRDAKLVLNNTDATKTSGRKRTYIACKPKDDKFAVVNSCNGLLCLCDPKDGDPLVVCNPMTGEFIRLPEATKIEERRSPIYATFGFHQKTNEYKVIRMCKRYITVAPYVRNYVGMVIEMHTLGTSTWKNIRGDLGVDHVLSFPTCINGALHWIFSDGWKFAILCFDFESERFRPFPSPPHVFNEGVIEMTSKVSMTELKGFLYLCDATSYGLVTMWVMKEYGIGESWIPVFSISPHDGGRWPHGLYWPVKIFKNGAATLMYHSCNGFIYYDHKEHGLKRSKVPGTQSNFEKYEFKFFKVRGTQSNFEAIPYVPSLISLKDAVKGDNVEVLNVHSRCAKFKLREEKEVIFLAEEDVEMVDFLYTSSSEIFSYYELGDEYSS
ncbi:hypothetical protein RIF29_17812 [Crotalaria pallida]|uniref:F-box protein n=1 Tax=Crotalaria pallida TaxID=3830 RepID=A0AAN9IDB1_CROPI